MRSCSSQRPTGGWGNRKGVAERVQVLLGMFNAGTSSGFVPIRRARSKGAATSPCPMSPGALLPPPPMPPTPLAGVVVGAHIPLSPTRNWIWQLLTERAQVRLARLCRMRIWLLTALSGQLRDRFTSVTGKLQNHETPPPPPASASCTSRSHSPPWDGGGGSAYETPQSLPKHLQACPTTCLTTPGVPPPAPCHTWARAAGG